MKRQLAPLLISLVMLPLLAAAVVAVFLTMEDRPRVAQYSVILALAYLLGSIPWGYILLRLPRELKGLFSEWLETHYPLRAAHVLSLVRQSRRGALNDSGFGTRMRVTISLGRRAFSRSIFSCGSWKKPSIGTSFFPSGAWISRLAPSACRAGAESEGWTM